MTNVTDLHLFRVRTPSFLISVELTPEVKQFDSFMEFHGCEKSLYDSVKGVVLTVGKKYCRKYIKK